jgi:hypothetical protein
LKTSYSVASDIVVENHLAHAVGLCEHINENYGKGLDYLTDHKILKGETLERFIPTFFTKFFN